MVDQKTQKDPKPASLAPGPMREEELMELVENVLEEDDPFFIPPDMIPEGYSVEWKRQTVLGARAPNQSSYEVKLARTRWEAVSISTHPSFGKLVPASYDKDVIEKEGMILMIRPKEITDKVRQIQTLKAQNQLSQKMAQLSNAGNGEAPRKVQSLNKSYAPAVQVPND